MGYYATTAKNTMLGSITVNSLSLHTDNPGAAGTSNEYSGGGYARQSATFGTAAEGKRKLSSAVAFSGTPGDQVSWVGFWSSSTFRGAKEITDAPKVFHADTGLLVLLKDDTYYGIDECA
jgi:hypothetical protein